MGLRPSIKPKSSFHSAQSYSDRELIFRLGGKATVDSEQFEEIGSKKIISK